MPWIERHRPSFYSHGALLFSFGGWIVCLGGGLYSSTMTVTVMEKTMVPANIAVLISAVFGGAILAAIGLIFAVIAYLLKVRDKKVKLSLLLGGLLAIPVGLILAISFAKSMSP